MDKKKDSKEEFQLDTFKIDRRESCVSPKIRYEMEKELNTSIVH